MKPRLILIVASLALLAAVAVEIKVGTGYNVTTKTGTDGPWVDSMVPAAGFKTGGSAPGWGDFTDANIQSLQFAKAAANLVHGSLQLNHDYREGTDIRAHAHLHFPTAALATASTNVWKLTYSWANMGAAFPASTSISVTNSGAVTEDEHRYVSFGAISGTGKTISSVIAVTIERTGTDDFDVYDDVISFMGFDVHYQADTIGSSAETTK